MNGICRLLLSLLFFSFVIPAGFAIDVATNLQSAIIEDFDNPEESPWFILGSKFSSVIRTDAGEEVYPKMAFVRTWPEALFRRPPEGRDLRALGIHGKFDRKGYNYVQIIPGQRGPDGNLIPRLIPLPGLVENMDLWVWGSNLDYYLEVHLMDHRGITHVLNFGDIRHVGWRNIRVNIPRHIPQTVTHVPKFRGLYLVKFVLWTQPHERVNNFFVYFDQVKILSDMFETPFDGDILADPVQVQQLWAESKGN